MTLADSTRLACARKNGGASDGGRYDSHAGSSVGPSSWWFSLAMAVAIAVSLTRSSGSSMCTGSDGVM